MYALKTNIDIDKQTHEQTTGAQSVEGLVRALHDEQEQRLIKERQLQDLLVREAMERAKAEEDLRKLERKVDHLMDRLCSPSIPAIVRGTVKAVKDTYTQKPKKLTMRAQH
jgi:hypothetical protein